MVSYTKPGWPGRILASAAIRRVLGLRGDVTPRVRVPRKMRHHPERLVLARAGGLVAYGPSVPALFAEIYP